VAAEQLPDEWLGVITRRTVRVVVSLGQDGYRGSLGRGQAGDRLGVALVCSVAEQVGGLVRHDREPCRERDRGVVWHADERGGADCSVGGQGVDHAPAGGACAVQAGDLQALGAGGGYRVVEPCRGYRALDVLADGDGGLGIAQGLGLKLAGYVRAELVEEADARSLADGVAPRVPDGADGAGPVWEHGGQHDGVLADGLGDFGGEARQRGKVRPRSG